MQAVAFLSSHNMAARVLVTYAYFEKNQQYKDNFSFFLKHGLHPHIQYVFVLNGPCTVQVPQDRNIRTIQRENVGYDFGAFEECLKLPDAFNYDHYVFLNTSVRGPFLPPYTSFKDWTEPFTNMINNNTKLVGTTINVEAMDFALEPHLKEALKPFHTPYAHVQSMFFAMDNEALKYLKKIGFFDQPPARDFFTFIVTREVNMSQLILKRGWNINCLIKEYKGLDYRDKDLQFPKDMQKDPYYPQACFGRSLHPYETIFFKTNRNVATHELESLSKGSPKPAIEHFSEPLGYAGRWSQDLMDRGDLQKSTAWTALAPELYSSGWTNFNTNLADRGQSLPVFWQG
jgi:hypothetical protein